MYCWDGIGGDPNRPLYLCEDCSQEYTEYMKDKWRDYYSSII
jgi:hypothetical protein